MSNGKPTSAERTKINPSLLIGLGGQGQKSLEEIHKRLVSVYGEVPPQIRRVAFDTDRQEAHSLEEGQEFLHLEVKGVWGHIESERNMFETWMDLERIPRHKHRNIHKGAGQIRQLGRFALHHLMNKIRPAIAAELRKIDSIKHEDDSRWDTSGCPKQIVFLGSIAGGTGAGMLLDLACAIAAMPEAKGWDRYAYLVMPGVFRPKPGTHYVEENGYAFLKELDFFLSSVEAIDRGDYGDRFDVDLGGSIKYRLSAPFENVMLVDNYSTADLSYETPEQLAEGVAIAVFTTLGGAIGQRIDAVLNNPENQGKAWDGGMLCNYSSFGVAELYYPREEFVAYARLNLAERLVVAMEIGQEIEGDDAGGYDVATALETFLDEHRLLERGKERNDIRDAILPLKRYTPRIPDAGNVKTDDVERIWQDNEDGLREFVGDKKGTARDARERKAEDARGELRAHVDRLISTRGGNAAVAFISEMLGYFEAVSAAIDKDDKEAKKRVKQHSGAVAALKDPCTKKAGKRFGRRQAVGEVLSSYTRTLQALARAECDVFRAGEVRILCSAVLSDLKELMEQASTQRSSLENLARKAAYEKHQARQAFPRPTPFQVPVNPDIDRLEMPDTRIDALYDWLADAKGFGALDFWRHKADDAMDIVLEYADHVGAAKHPQKMTLASVLATKGGTEIEEYLRLVSRRSKPLLPHKDVGGTRREQERAESRYLIGATSEFLDFFSSEDESGGQRDFADRLRSLEVRHIDSADIPDPDRAYFFCHFGAIPAYALGSFELLRNEYVEHVSIPTEWSLHLDKRWDDILPDLDPRATDEDSWIWALASSDIDYLGCVGKSGTHYTLSYGQKLADGAEQETSISLGQGQEQARKRFLDNREWVSHAQQRIEQGIAKVGNDRALEDLARLRDSLDEERKKAERSGDDERSLAFQRDVEAVAEYRTRL